MIDERPIRPDKKYLDEYIERMSKPEKKDYLRKKPQTVLPCFSHRQRKEPKPQPEDKRSKAELYEEIKLKNLRRFGEKKMEQIKEEKTKKIDPKKMTVNYKPKHGRPVIDTEEYKLKKEDQQRVKRNSKQKQLSQIIKKDSDSKVEYEKLLDYFKSELNNFQKEKEQFDKVASKLRFKDMISKEQGLSYSKIKSQVENNLITQNLSLKSHNIGASPIRQHQSQSKSKQKKQKIERQCYKSQPKVSHLFSKTFSISQIRNCMKETNEKLQQLKEKIFCRDLKVNEHRYDISQIYLLPQFDPQTIYEYLDSEKLRYNGNDNYRAALKAFNSKFQRENQQENNICEEQKQEGKARTEIKVKFIGEKRVMKYEGWTEVWIPGKQRLMANKQGYKVIWLCNGDVLQEFGNQTKAYYSKLKEVMKIQFRKQFPIYFHSNSHQIWRTIEEGKRQVVFGNGRKQIVEEEKDDHI